MQSKRKRQGVEPLRVVIVSNNSETLDGLQEYLLRAGVATSGTRQLQSAAIDGPGVVAVVIFPDDFVPTDVVGAVTRIVRERPGVLTLLVTRSPRRFESLAARNDAELVPIIIPKPAWGWAILETVRARLGT